MLKTFISWFKKFSPFLGLSALFFLFVLLTVFLFNYYNSDSLAWAQRVNPYYLLVRWDSVHYLEVALNGFSGSSVLFPLYPFLITLFSVFFPAIFSGFLISFLSLATALYYLNLLLKETGYEKIYDRTAILLLSFPAALFFSLIYTESLFLLLVIAFFYYLQKRHWRAAALIGFLAVLTRNIGIFLWPVYLVSLLSIFYDASLKGLGKNIIALIRKKEFWLSLIIPAGLFLYCFYCYLQFGDWFTFIRGQQGWAQWRTFMWPWKTLANLFKVIFLDSIGETGLYNFIRIVIIEGGAFLLLSATTIYWLKKKHWPYAMFCLLNTLLFSFMYPMLSVNRYVVVIFPIFIFLASITKKYNWLFYSTLFIFTIFFVLNVYQFSIGSWVG